MNEEPTTYRQMEGIDLTIIKTRIILIDCESGVKLIIRPHRRKKIEIWLTPTKVGYINSWLWMWKKNWENRATLRKPWRKQ